MPLAPPLMSAIFPANLMAPSVVRRWVVALATSAGRGGVAARAHPGDPTDRQSPAAGRNEGQTPR